MMQPQKRLSEALNSLPSSSSGVNCSGFPSITCINLIAINHNVSRSSQCLLVGTIKRRWFDFCSKDSYLMPINTAKYSRFFSFAINPEISVKEIMLVEDLDSIFVLPLSLPAFEEVLDLQSFLRLVDYDRIQMMVFHIG